MLPNRSIFLNVTKIMVGLGYSVDKEGACAGYEAMLRQAIYCGETDIFYQRLNNLADYLNELEDLNKLIEELKIYRDLSKDDELSFENMQVDSLSMMQINLKKHLYQIKFPNSEENKLKHAIIQDFFHFFDGIALSQRPHDPMHQPFLNESNLSQADIEKISKVTSSIELEKRGNATAIPGLSSFNTYDLGQLKAKLDEIKEVVEKIHLLNNDKNLSREIAFTFQANNHAINVRYHPLAQKWFIGDINYGEKFNECEGQDATYGLAYALLTSDILINEEVKDFIDLEIRASTTGDYALIAIESKRTNLLPDLVKLKFDMTQVCQKYSIKKTEDLIDVKRSIGDAICDDDAELTRTYVKLGADPKANILLNYSLLHSAAALKSFNAFAALIECGANFNALDNKSHTPIHILFETFNSIEAEGNENAKEKYKSHALHIMSLLINKGNLVDLLLKENKAGVTAFAIALKNPDKFLIVAILLSLKDLQDLETHLKDLHLFKKEITKSLINYLNTQPNKKEILESIFKGENALGKFLHTPKDPLKFFSSSKQFAEQKVTSSILTLREYEQSLAPATEHVNINKNN